MAEKDQLKDKAYQEDKKNKTYFKQKYVDKRGL